MKILILVIIVAVAVAAGFLAGRLTGAFSPKALAHMDEFVDQMTELNADTTYQTVQECELYISLLQQLEHGNSEQAKKRLVEELGHTYYNYTYEDERDMNPKEIEQVLVKIDTLSKESSLFSLVVEFTPINDDE